MKPVDSESSLCTRNAPRGENSCYSITFPLAAGRMHDYIFILRCAISFGVAPQTLGASPISLRGIFVKIMVPRSPILARLRFVVFAPFFKDWFDSQLARGER